MVACLSRSGGVWRSTTAALLLVVLAAMMSLASATNTTGAHRALRQAGSCSKATGCPGFPTYCCSQWGFCGTGTGYCNANSLCGPGTPAGACGGGSSVGPTPASVHVCLGAYIVRSGDSLWSISQARATTVAAIQEANRMGTSTSIFPGQMLRIPPCQWETPRPASGLVNCVSALISLFSGVSILTKPWKLTGNAVAGLASNSLDFAGALGDGACNMGSGLDVAMQIHNLQTQIDAVRGALVNAELNDVTTQVERIKDSLRNAGDQMGYKAALTGPNGPQRDVALNLLRGFNQVLQPMWNRLRGSLTWRQMCAAAPKMLYLASVHHAVYREYLGFGNCPAGIQYIRQDLANRYRVFQLGQACQAENPTLSQARTFDASTRGWTKCELLCRWHGWSFEIEEALARLGNGPLLDQPVVPACA